VALGISKAKAPTKGLSKLNSMAFGLAVYASPSSLPPPTQDSLPAAAQALPDGLSTRMVPLRGFGVVDYISSSSPKLLGAKGVLGQFRETASPHMTTDPSRCFAASGISTECRQRISVSAFGRTHRQHEAPLAWAPCRSRPSGKREVRCAHGWQSPRQFARGTLGTAVAHSFEQF